MIGVVTDPEQAEVVREFFELFKTPWEFYRKGQRYDVLLCAGSAPIDHAARLLIFYAGRLTDYDSQQSIETGARRQHASRVVDCEKLIPIYGDSITFPKILDGLLSDEQTGQCVAYLQSGGDRVVARIGYDLFNEVRTLLTVGQPLANANIPALERHISFLRRLIVDSGLSLLEVPPVPRGFRFIVCLTHDVDHPSLRFHKWDHTLVGFLWRAVFGSLSDLIRGRLPFRTLLRNWWAALKLPLVHLGAQEDWWAAFDREYLRLERGIRSTFFVIPFKGRPGRKRSGTAPKFRSSSYKAKDIKGTIEKLVASGCEVGLHGIDAWIDEASGGAELDEIRSLTGESNLGVRMHWLYYDGDSPQVLEKAGAIYDSTVGYNETVGYRAGTTQVYKPLNASKILELPLHVMDTAMFYPSHLGLSPSQAKTLLQKMADEAVQVGGCLTINWHDRSLGPERCWDGTYRDLIEDLKNRGAWFATAGQAVAWFQKRRSITFDRDAMRNRTELPVRGADQDGNDLADLQFRMFPGQEADSRSPSAPEHSFEAKI